MRWRMSRMELMRGNSKSEIRNSKQIRNPNSKMQMLKCRVGCSLSGLCERFLFNGRCRVRILPGLLEFFRHRLQVDSERVIDGFLFPDFSQEIGLASGEEF